MTDSEPHPLPEDSSPLGRTVGSQAERKLRARRHVTHTVWQGLGMMGMVGWSVTIPTLAGAALGLWIDRRYPSSHSWTLAFLVLGLLVGCANAWHWVAREHRAMREEREEDSDDA